MENSNQRNWGIILFPLVLAIVLALGYFLGSNARSKGDTIATTSSETAKMSKLQSILNEVELRYVDTVKTDELLESSISGILSKLDPHSAYIPVSNVAATDEPLRGGFGGVGIRFMILRDTLTITNIIERGPSEQAGLRAGDRILAVNDSSIVGVGLKNQDVLNRLKGDPGTRVDLTIFRKSSGETRKYKVTRGIVPIKSVESTQMLTNDIGFIKLARFAETTPKEIQYAAKKLRKKGMKKLVLDLRGNGGGFLHTAVDLADQFLPMGNMIVYTEGKWSGRNEYTSRPGDSMEDIGLVVLIDANSASASEIIAGAIQDNDRGVIMGRRSFGKGLVQDQIPLSDGSVMRLTISRYYTPSGRCIQKPYGDGIDYDGNFYDRYANGEHYNLDSTLLKSLEKFTTKNGRTVYGGGGIFPDVFIPLDTTGASAYLTSLAYSPAFSEFAFDYVDRNRKTLQRYSNPEKFGANFEVTDQLFNSFLDFAAVKHGIEVNAYGKKASEKRIKTRLKAQIAQNIWEENGWFTVFIKNDREVIRAIEELQTED